MALAEQLLSVGIKGQDIILAELNKVKKKADAIFKMKPSLDVGKGILDKAQGKKVPGIPALAGQPTTSPEQEKSEKQQEKSDKKLTENTKKFGAGVKEFTKGAATFDPTTAVQNVITGGAKALGAGFAALPAVGQYLKDLPKGFGEVINSMVGMASGALQIAKQAAEAQYGLTQRNSTTGYFGGGGVGMGSMSNAEHANLVMNIAGSYGKLQKPMIDALNELVGKKDTNALGAAASGNWSSLGTTKGWLLQQMTNSLQGMPPEIAQQFNAALLKNNGADIQGNEDQQGQEVNAAYKNRQEQFIGKQYAESTVGGTAAKLQDLDNAMQKFSINLLNAGVGCAEAMDYAAVKVTSMSHAIEDFKTAINGLPSVIRNKANQIFK